ncbi:MAG: cytochrome P450 [Pseudomonadota bacterium]
MTTTTLKSIDDLPEFPVDDLFAESAVPYEILAECRAKSPLMRVPMGFPMGLRHRHIEAMVNDSVTRQLETESKILQGITSGPIYDLADLAMLTANGEAHMRRRMPVARTFAFKLMDAMRPRVTELVSEIVTERLGAGPVDFVEEVASELPARIIAEILGIPMSDVPVFRQWIQDTAAALGYVEPEHRERIEASLSAFAGYVSDLLADRRAAPRDDFLTDYVQATAASGDMSEGEIRTQVLGLILAGSDTTRGSLCMTLSELLQHPDQWRAFCADPDGLKRGAVEEGIRFQPVISALARVAIKDFELDGYLIPDGCMITISLVSAMRDPDVFSNPDAFDIRRKDHPRWNFVFGAGAHRCVGEALARAEMEEALATIARLAPNTTLVGDPPALAPGAIRQVGPMSVAFEA